MVDIIKIKCPFDGAVLTVMNQPGIESKNVTCPICKQSYPFKKFKRIAPVSPNKGQNLASYNEEHTEYASGNPSYNPRRHSMMNFTLGKIKIINSNISYQLKSGRNVIGRSAAKSQADFQIDTGNSRLMSREHIIIDVKKVPEKGMVHYVSLYKEQVNDTYIDNEQLLYGDCIVLNNGNIIKLPGISLRFEIPDNEGTDF